MLSDVASQSGDPLANAGALLGLSDSVYFGRFTRHDQEGAEIALAEIRPTTESVTHGALASRDANEEEPPQVAQTRAATSLASALQNTAQAPVQIVRPRVKVDIPTYTGYHDCKSANEYLDRLLHNQHAMELSVAKLLERVVPVSLTEQAHGARWY
ncbi:hypothetical protein HPB51_018545 [Rhipicephalus microplus]|uniref:Uncharacterized protein n=1 Tax=Rhipicephalus microplus TaxID=6941 RepID=A0A9J6DIF3_RHIMP|nr:hypothetical protein HPB51_018545 [Rhipicephalus microplus]